MTIIKHVLFQLLILLSQTLNVLLLGYADESTSSRCYRSHMLGHSRIKLWALLYHIVNTLFWDVDHCKDSYMSELKRRQMPPELRNNNNVQRGSR